MTIRELIKQLQGLPEADKELLVMVGIPSYSSFGITPYMNYRTDGWVIKAAHPAPPVPREVAAVPIKERCC